MSIDSYVHNCYNNIIKGKQVKSENDVAKAYRRHLHNIGKQDKGIMRRSKTLDTLKPAGT